MNEMPLLKFGEKAKIGSAAQRKEDRRFVTGHGNYTGDATPEGTLHAHVLRSSHAHARFQITNVNEVRAIAGVSLVLTHEDIKEFGSIPCRVPLGKDENGNQYQAPSRPLLASGIARYVGDPIAFIVAETKQQAVEAAEALIVDYDPQPVVVETDEAMVENSVAVWPGFAEKNKAAESTIGDKKLVEAAFDKADRVIELTIINNRLVCNYMEARACLVEYDTADDLLTLTTGTQGVHSQQDVIATKILKIDKDKLRVVTPDVGGGFGTKGFIYHEYPLSAIAARELQRPVKWECDRTEHFLADAHGRDNISTARMALDKQGRFLALDVEILANMGAYLSDFSAFIPWLGASMATGLYDIPALHAHVTCVFTHTTPVDAYRGAGRPEATYLLERLVDYIALDIGMDANELRRLNFIKPEQFPYKTPAGRMYDVGEFDGHLTRALELTGWNDFEARRAGSADDEKLRGIGLATYIEACAFAGSEPAHVVLNDDGSVTLFIGTQSTGQGHETAYAQFVSAALDLDLDRIHVRQGNTDELKSGGGTGGSRSVPIGGVSVDRASIVLRDKIKEIASDALEVSASDLEVSDGDVRVMGTDRLLSFADVAAHSEEPLSGVADVQQTEATYPNGTHICELEVDKATGDVEILAYTIVDDFGMTVNPLLLAGQVHGGVVQGIGQALYEHTAYDETGQLLSASFMDYAMPRADHIPNFHFETRNVPSTTNALGIKGAGEAGSIGSCPAVMNALVNALHPSCGVTHIDMPARPEILWKLINE